MQIDPLLPVADAFVDRHIGPDQAEIAAMLAAIGVGSLDELVARTVPESLRMEGALALGEGMSEYQVLAELRKLAAQNRLARSFIGMGYVDCVTPPVIQRNILENPGWYTQYTPYQAEISQGRLEALLNFQTMICDLTGMELANASLLDEATAAAEAMAMMHGLQQDEQLSVFWMAADCHPQTLAVVRTRAQMRGWTVVVGDCGDFDFDDLPVFGVLLQYPTTDGAIHDYRNFVERAHRAGALVAVAADILSLCLLSPPAEFGADAVVGSTQRLGMPMGYGGPHAAYFATREIYKRQIPGRIVGVSVDAQGKPALRMALQTREQHIRRERATSNICTAEVLPAVVASMYAVYHGPAGLQRIAERIHRAARLLAEGARRLGWEVVHAQYFDTLRLRRGAAAVDQACERAGVRQLNLRRIGADELGITLGETVNQQDLEELLSVLAGQDECPPALADLDPGAGSCWAAIHRRQTPFLTHPVFNTFHSETEMLRYISRLQARDLSLTTSMIPLGSCTMKLNATAQMMPITWPEFAGLHPFAPEDQARGYQLVFAELGQMLARITGLPAVSLQPNAGSQGEFTGLLAIRQYQAARGEGGRDICLIPASAHGTNPASAVMAGLKVVVVQCDGQGNIDLADLRQKAVSHADRLAALMATYPSTHGVFEEGIRESCAIVHQYGGQVYLDGANMNAMVGLCRPADIGVDICHLNLHKTFCIPHGGGGPGMGPVAAAAQLANFLPGHPLREDGSAVGPVAAAPWGSALILLISWAYLKMMGGAGLTRATQVAILNANYLAHRLDDHFPLLYRGKQGFIAHEAILDLRQLKTRAGISVEDVAKRLMDYGYHAPTVSFPVPGTVMVEPTESESRKELDRFCEAMIAIAGELEAIEKGEVDRHNNLLKNAPHTAQMICSDLWEHPYSRQQAALPASWSRENKFWPAVGRVDNAQGDRHLVCTCMPLEWYAQQ